MCEVLYRLSTFLPLDPYIALALTNLSLMVAETAYMIGYQDGQGANHATANCQLCNGGTCVMGEV